MATMAEVFHQANDFLSFQTKEPPVGMLYNGHITETSKVEVVGEVKGDICSNQESLDGSFAAPTLCQQSEVDATSDEISRDSFGG